MAREVTELEFTLNVQPAQSSLCLLTVCLLTVRYDRFQVGDRVLASNHLLSTAKLSLGVKSLFKWPGMLVVPILYLMMVGD